MRSQTLALLFLAMFPLGNIAQSNKPCNPQGSGQCCVATTIGSCFALHGRYGIYVENNGIWSIRERRLLITAGDAALDEQIYKLGGSFNHALEGDFKVCPVSKDEHGRVASVCVQSSNILKPVERH